MVHRLHAPLHRAVVLDQVGVAGQVVGQPHLPSPVLQSVLQSHSGTVWAIWSPVNPLFICRTVWSCTNWIASRYAVTVSRICRVFPCHVITSCDSGPGPCRPAVWCAAAPAAPPPAAARCPGRRPTAAGPGTGSLGSHTYRTSRLIWWGLGRGDWDNSQIWESFIDVVGREENFLLAVPDHDLVRRLPRGVDQLQLQPGQLHRQPGGEGGGGEHLYSQYTSNMGNKN